MIVVVCWRVACRAECLPRQRLHTEVDRYVQHLPKRLVSRWRNRFIVTRFMLLSKLQQVTLDCRTLPGQDEEYVLEQVRRALGPVIADDQDHCSLSVK